MISYIIRRLLLIIPTMLGILLIVFPIIQLAPGGPVEQYLANLQGEGGSTLNRISGGDSATPGVSESASEAGGDVYRGAQGVTKALRKQIEKQFGFDDPIHIRFFKLIKNYATFDFGESYFKQRPVVDLFIEKLPVSIALGVWLTLLSYLVCIPLGIAKAVRDGTRFDIFSSAVLVVGYAIPYFLLAVVLISLFANGEFLTIFPRTGLFSENYDELSWTEQIADYFWHLTLPLASLAVGTFTTITFLIKNSFLDEINKAYVITARAKGNSERRILYRHVLRNASLIIIAGFPGTFIGAFFTGSLLIEITFGLDGLGLLGFEAVVGRDFPIIFANIYIFGLLGLLINLLSDVIYAFVDPRIDFEKRG